MNSKPKRELETNQNESAYYRKKCIELLEDRGELINKYGELIKEYREIIEEYSQQNRAFKFILGNNNKLSKRTYRPLLRKVWVNTNYVIQLSVLLLCQVA